MKKVFLLFIIFIFSLNIVLAIHQNDSVYDMTYVWGSGASQQIVSDLIISNGFGQNAIGNKTTDDINVQTGIYYIPEWNTTISGINDTIDTTCRNFSVNNITSGTNLFNIDCNGNTRVLGNLNLTNSNLDLGGCIRYNCTQPTGCVTIGSCI